MHVSQHQTRNYVVAARIEFDRHVIRLIRDPGRSILLTSVVRQSRTQPATAKLTRRA